MAREMKDSGVEWIGKIPEKWGIYRLGKISKIITGQTLPKTENDLYYSSEGLMWVKPDSLTGLTPIFSTKEYINDFGKNKVVIAPPMTPLVCCIGSIGKTGYALSEATFNQQINAVIFDCNVYPKFGLYSLIANEEQHWFYSNGNVLKILNTTGQKQITLAIPNINEQQRISSFLDSKCKEIDNVLAKTRSSIEEYKKLKQAIITKAVTKGIRNNRKMKDSGIEWIGEIPEDWICAELKYFVNLINGKEVNNEIDKEQSGAVPVYGSGGIFKYTDDYMYDGVGILFGRKGTLGKPIYLNGKFWIVDTAYLISCNNNLCSRFCYYALCAFDWGKHITQTALPSIVATDIISCKFPIPEITEQELIVSFLDDKCAKIDTLISKKEQLISELESYKKSLIYEYVTGKKEVPTA